MELKFNNKDGEFTLRQADHTSYLYFPIANEAGIMGNVNPILSGDSKMDQNHFLLEPVSAENLHTSNMGRNFWVRIDGRKLWSVAGNSPMQMGTKYSGKKEEVTVEAGLLYHKVIRENKEIGIKAEVLNYCPAGNSNAEVMKVTIKNTGEQEKRLEPIAAVPIYGRSADNLRDHRHVTSLLHRTYVRTDGIEVIPTMSFDERGHGKNDVTYGVYGRDDHFKAPKKFYPILEEFIGEGGNLQWPEGIVIGSAEAYKAGDQISGFESIGAMEFEGITLKGGDQKTYYILLSYNGEGKEYLEKEIEESAFEKTQQYWKQQHGISLHTRDSVFDTWMSWVDIQPTLRRIYGCSFLPHHDYGRGGRGYRDLWQDCLALMLRDPREVRESLISFYGGVRIDGSNATIIGVKPGEFIADRNSIVRVWMDHGLWPFITTLLYLNQTGDMALLFEQNTYFKDSVSHRGEGKDALYHGQYKELRTYGNGVYKGSILEHILVQHLTVFYDVGEHNHMKLRGADWNDALDMAKERGESVAFTAAYAGNLSSLAQALRKMAEQGIYQKVTLAKELMILLHQTEEVYRDAVRKRELLKQYCDSCTSYVSGQTEEISLLELAQDLEQKADWIKRNIRASEWIQGAKGYQWFNSYYDNEGKQVEGSFQDGIRMMLTGQVFTIMSNTATDEQVMEIVKAVDTYLYEESVGGYRLNTDFEEVKMDLGRMFGFAYGHKENGSVFSHMAVMYAYALYQRGFVKEGYKALHTLYKQSVNFKKSRIYPGLPEYFNQKGRGMYNYLTGSASWYVLTVLTEMFGIKGTYGDLMFVPKLVAQQFDSNGMAQIQTQFAGRKLVVQYENKKGKDIGDYEVEEVFLNDELYLSVGEQGTIARGDIQALEVDEEHCIRVVLV